MKSLCCAAQVSRAWKKIIDTNHLMWKRHFDNDGFRDIIITNGFPKESPGNIGKFIGWNIVKSYMSNHKEVTLEQLMNEKSMQKIFDESRYKPLK